MSQLRPATKLGIIISVFALTVAYALFERTRVWRPSQDAQELILAQLPAFEVTELSSGTSWDAKKAIRDTGAKGLLVHFWGTWCAPCEAEFPELVKLADNLSSKGVLFVLIAVNDEKAKVERFLKRFKLSSNVVIALDPQGGSMPLFGTIKVPESYLFNSQGVHLNKYVGPQEWNNPSFPDQFERLLK